VKKEKNRNNSLFFLKRGEAQMDKEIHCKKERETIKINSHFKG
jgi:hypothetical protein